MYQTLYVSLNFTAVLQKKKKKRKDDFSLLQYLC